MTEEAIESALAGAALVYFDGRLTESAMKLAQVSHALLCRIVPRRVLKN